MLGLSALGVTLGFAIIASTLIYIRMSGHVPIQQSMSYHLPDHHELVRDHYEKEVELVMHNSYATIIHSRSLCGRYFFNNFR